MKDYAVCLYDEETEALIGKAHGETRTEALRRAASADDFRRDDY